MTFLADEENSDDLYWGIKTWEASTGEMRPRIFDLLRHKSGGRMLILFEEFSKAWVVCQFIEKLSEVVVWLAVRF